MRRDPPIVFGDQLGVNGGENSARSAPSGSMMNIDAV